MALRLTDETMTMTSECNGDVVRILYREGHGSRREAAVIARRYARDWYRQRAVFASRYGNSYVYRLV